MINGRGVDKVKVPLPVEHQTYDHRTRDVLIDRALWSDAHNTLIAAVGCTKIQIAVLVESQTLRSTEAAAGKSAPLPPDSPHRCSLERRASGR